MLANGQADADNVIATCLHEPAPAPPPTPGTGPLDPAHSDEFSGPLGPQWYWLRVSAAGTPSGPLEFPRSRALSLYPMPVGARRFCCAASPEGDDTVQAEVTFRPW